MKRWFFAVDALPIPGADGGAAVVIFAFVVGMLCGLTAGLYRGLDNPIMRVMDASWPFPPSCSPWPSWRRSGRA